MTRYIAFLRAINTSGRYVKSAQLRAAFESLPGLQRVQTFINSGNVFFDADAPAAELEQAIQTHLPGALGFASDTFLRTGPEMAALLEHNPFAAEEAAPHTTLYVAFLRAAPLAERREKLLALASAADQLHFYQNHVFWRYRRDQGKSLIDNSKLERLLAAPATTRNITTVRKIKELLWS